MYKQLFHIRQDSFPILFLTIVLIFNSWHAIGQNPRELCDQASEMVQLGDSEMLSTLTIIDAKGRERIRKISSARKQFKDGDKMLMKFIEPPEVAGTAMLIHDHDQREDDMWIYLPALRKTRRILSKDKSKHFMGSEFRNADLSEPDPNDFIYEYLGKEDIMDKSHHKVKLSCKNPDVSKSLGYEYKIMWIESGSKLTSFIHYFSKGAKLNRKQYFINYRTLAKDTYYAATMIMENMTNKRKSILHIEEIQGSSSLSEWMFSPSKLPDL